MYNSGGDSDDSKQSAESSSYRAAAVAAVVSLPTRTAGPNCKNPPKMRFEKFVKLKDPTCACNDLTNFECEAQAAINRNYVNFQKLAWKNL
jgi:hypothetical protein